jgi:hypothetical protein
MGNRNGVISIHCGHGPALNVPATYIFPDFLTLSSFHYFIEAENQVIVIGDEVDTHSLRSSHNDLQLAFHPLCIYLLHTYMLQHHLLV